MDQHNICNAIQNLSKIEVSVSSWFAVNHETILDCGIQVDLLSKKKKKKKKKNLEVNLYGRAKIQTFITDWPLSGKDLDFNSDVQVNVWFCIDFFQA